MNRRVLCLFYYFPPSGGAGSLRSLAAAEGLVRQGWHPTILTPRGNVYHTSGGDLDIAPGIEVVRTSHWELRRAFSPLRRLGVSDEALGRIARLLWLPDYQVGWIPFLHREASRLLASGRFDALISSGAPWSSHLAARSLARRFRLPWAALFADEWSTSTEVPWATPLHRHLNRRWEGQVLRDADVVTVTTATMGRRLAGAHPGLSPRIEILDNGFDERDFRDRRRTPHRRFTFLFAGSLYPSTSPRALLPALRKVLDARADRASRIRLRMIGSCHTDFQAHAGRLGLSDIVVGEGPRPHSEAVQAMLDAHVLVDARSDQASAAAQHPVKLLEYLRAGSPILGFYPDGEAASLLERFAGSVRVKPGDVEGAARALEAWITCWERGQWPEPPPIRTGLEGMDRDSQASRLAAILDSISDSISGRR